MRLRLHNALSGALEEFTPASPPALVLSLRPSEDWRKALFAETLGTALTFLGYAVRAAAPGEEPDLAVGDIRPARACRCWVKPAGGGDEDLRPLLRARGFEPADLRWLTLGTHYRSDGAFPWAELATARHQRLECAGAVRLLKARGGALAPNTRGVAGYRKRFRDALGEDFDFPGALACLFDALRPGALSPGSQLAAAGDFEAALFPGFSL